MFVDVTHPGNVTLPKKAKLKLTVGGTEHACTSGAHASALLKKAGHSLSSCDVYNFLTTARRTPKLEQRWPKDVTVERLT